MRSKPANAVIGATGAVGSAVAAQLAGKGRRVVAVSRDASRTETVAAPFRSAIGVAGVFSDPATLGAIGPGVAINCTVSKTSTPPAGGVPPAGR